MKYSILKTILALFVVFNVQSQELINSQTLVSTPVGGFYSFDRSDKTIQGSPYMGDGFSPAKIKTDKEVIYKVRYNMVSDEIEVESEDKAIKAINKNIKGLNVTFMSNNKTYQPRSYIDEEGKANKGYFVVLTNTNNEHPLLLKESKKYVPGKAARSSYQQAKPAEFKRMDDAYFIVVKNETAVEIPRNKKDVAKLFPEHEDAILDYIKEERLKTNNESDLIKLALYINTL